MYELLIAPKATKFMRDLPVDYREVIKDRLKELESELKPRGAVQLNGKPNCYRLRVGPYRIQYQLMEDNVVLIYKISRRDETTYE